MQLIKNVSSLLVGALLATSAAGELTKVARPAGNVVKRDEYTDRMVDRCAATSSKKARSLLARGEVDMRDGDHGRGEDELWTDGLNTCRGVAVVGDLPDDAPDDVYDRWLVHTAGGDGLFTTDPLNDFEDEVKKAIDAGLTNIRAKVVLMNPESWNTDDEIKDDEDTLKAQIENQQSNNDDTLSRTEKVTGLTITPDMHDLGTYKTLGVNSDKSFRYEDSP